MHEDYIDTYVDSLNYTLQNFDKNTAFLKDCTPFDIKVPKHCKTWSNSTSPLVSVKSISSYDLSKMADNFRKQHVENIKEQALINLRHQIEEYFDGLLKKRGITKEDWEKYGSYETTPDSFIYLYKGNKIFKVTYPELQFESESFKGTYSVYYEEIE